ncbi:MAG: LCP family protein [Oscillospiraceae bacterium]|nr:LCP family protein [Oscillospiraceae bacterium]
MKIFGNKRNAAHVAKPQKPRRRGLRIFLIIMVSLLVVAGGAYLALSYFIRPPVLDTVVLPPREAPSAPQPGNEPSVSNEPEEVELEIFTVLIAGQDNVGHIGLTDALMLASVNVSNGAINLVSIPRDTMVDVNAADRKINAVFPITGSMDNLVEEVGRITGFLPDYYITIGLRAFIDLVDVLGGVEFNVPIRMQYNDPYQSPPLHINLQPGEQQLTGEQAQQLVRFRGYPSGDIGRIETQHAFLHAVAGELLQIGNVARITDLAGIFIEHVDTNMPLGNLIWMGTQLMGMDEENLNFHTMPGEPGAGHIVIALEPWLEMINNYLNPFPIPVTEEHVQLFTHQNGSITLVGDGESLSQYLVQQ